MKKYITFTLPLIQGSTPPVFLILPPPGRGFFQYNFGLLPFRRAIHTVIGTPRI
jgi:hypothetical protein